MVTTSCVPIGCQEPVFYDMNSPSVAVALIAALPPTLAAVLSFVQARYAHRSSTGTAIAVEHLRVAVDEVRAGLRQVELGGNELGERVARLEGGHARRRHAPWRP